MLDNGWERQTPAISHSDLKISKKRLELAITETIQRIEQQRRLEAEYDRSLPKARQNLQKLKEELLIELGAQFDDLEDFLNIEFDRVYDVIKSNRIRLEDRKVRLKQHLDKINGSRTILI